VEGRGFVVVHPLGMVFDEQVQQDPEFEELTTRVIVVKAVEANSVAEEQGVKAGMVVEEINGVHVQEEALNTMVAFEAQVRRKRTGS
jgi:S1-C subfamily serine protease